MAHIRKVKASSTKHLVKAATPLKSTPNDSRALIPTSHISGPA